MPVVHANFPKKNAANGVDSGGNPPDDGQMEARLTKLESFAEDARDRLVRIETHLDNTATKADVADLRTEVHKGFSDMVKWIVLTAFALGATGITVMTFVLNNAAPKQSAQPAPQPQPIIITIPQQPAAATPAPPEPRKK
jgi:hypothetical protein